jgi:two-component system CheB/CheR fusion protein
LAVCLRRHDGRSLFAALPSRSSASGLRILVADGHADGADTLALLLQLWGHDVCVARTGPQALEAASVYRPDVVLIELVLPGLDGYELARRLQGQAVLIALTGLGGGTYRRRSWEAGFTLHLLKPVEPPELKGILSGLAWARELMSGGTISPSDSGSGGPHAFGPADAPAQCHRG